jgi:hypothetical protein
MAAVSLPRSMSRAVASAVALMVLLGACDRSGGAEPPAPTASTTPSPDTSPSPTFSSEGYLYTSKEGIEALATFDGAGGTLEVENRSGDQLAPPGLYLLDAATGAVVDAEVSPSRAVPDGEGHTYRVRLARAMPPASIGLVVLLIGDEDRGAFLPPRPTRSAEDAT